MAVTNDPAMNPTSNPTYNHSISSMELSLQVKSVYRHPPHTGLNEMVVITTHRLLLKLQDLNLGYTTTPQRASHPSQNGIRITILLTEIDFDVRIPAYQFQLDFMKSPLFTKPIYFDYVKRTGG